MKLVTAVIKPHKWEDVRLRFPPRQECEASVTAVTLA